VSSYAYSKASAGLIDRVRSMERACQAHGVPLRAAALKFSLRDPRIASTVVGTATPAHVDELVGLASLEMPDGLWQQLSELVPPESEWIGPER
jgi:D-threo-aldose 1-dehydrogenase